jgi:asparagine synthase (glutamine-hydrolysing)
MSGILGMVNWTGAPAEEALLERMAGAAAHRGPDGRGYWRHGKVGLGLLSLQLGPESVDVAEPVSRDGLVLVADARIDNRNELIPMLRQAGQLRLEVPSDFDIILAAYGAWGMACAAHLIGDFAFAVWDGPRERLFAARDPMGMRPLYYREEAHRFLFASEVKQILALPDVPAQVFEPALLAHIAGPYGRPEWSFYQGIRQLPAGNALVADSRGARVRRFWEPDPAACIRYRHEAEYAEHFRSLFEEAVACRMRSHRPVGLLLSGGVDSGSIAAMAGLLMEQGGAASAGFRAYSWAFDDLVDCDERSISDVIVDRYRLERTNVIADEEWPLQRYPEHAPDRDEPHLWVYQPLFDRTLERARADGMGAVFTGDRGDEVVGDWVWDHPGMFLAGRWRLLRKELQALGEPGWNGLKKRVLRPLFQGGHSQGRVMPLAPWLAPEALARCGLEDLIRGSRAPELYRDPYRQLRYERIFSFTGMRIAMADERRWAAHGVGYADPWSDLRLAEFVLAIPQWRVNWVSEPKRLAREALKGVMPEAVRKRTGKTIPGGLFERGFKERAIPAVRDLLREPVSEKMGLLDGDRLRREYDAFLAGQTPRHDFWWPLTAEFWLRAHFV